jgi:hypothetical protein
VSSKRGALAARLFPACLAASIVGFGLYFDFVANAQDAPARPKEILMSSTSGKAQHGPRSEVNWEGGSGRQPYANQGEEEAAEPNADDDHVPEGNRGDRSGRNLDQLEQARRKP